MNVRDGDPTVELVDRTGMTLLIVTVGFRQHSGCVARPCWSTVMSTIHACPADTLFGDELSLTVAQPPASATPVNTSAMARATTTIDLRTEAPFTRMPLVHRRAPEGSTCSRFAPAGLIGS